MRAFLNLAMKSLWHRKETIFLTILSLALSIFLVLSVELLRRAAENGFTQTISQTDLIVGARTGPTNLVLATVFNRGTFANNIKEATYSRWKQHPAVEWTIPLALGDGHRGYRVVGTTEDFFQHYRYQGHQALALREGVWSAKEQEVVVGSEVARSLAYKLGQTVIIDHGVTRDVGMIHHDDKPFSIVGILAPTGTIIDQSLFVTLESLEHLHDKAKAHSGHDEHEHELAQKQELEQKHEPESAAAGAPVHNQSAPDHSGHGDSPSEPAHSHSHPESAELTAFFLKLKNRVDILTLQRSINNFSEEPLSAVIPSVVVNELWQMLSTVEKSLRVLGYCILIVSLLSMLSILLATLNERRREMSILRAIGARPFQIAALLILESTLITLFSLGLGFTLQVLASASMGGWLKEKYGLFIDTAVFGTAELQYFLIILGLGLLVGIVPALRAYRTTLKDGLLVGR